MVFVDPLTVMLLSLGASAFLIAAYFYTVAKGKNPAKLAVPGFAFGAFDFISGFIMSFTWPFPGPVSAYNMLFGDPMLFLGIIMLAGSYMLYKNIDVKILSIPAFFLGIYMAVGAVAMITLKLETGLDLLSAFGLYGFSALSALLSPIVYANPKKSRNLYYLIFILLIIVAIIALFIGYSGLYEHLASPP